VRKYSFAARRAGATEEHQRAVAAVKALLDSPAYDGPRSAINEAIMFLQDGDAQTGLDLHFRSVEKYPHDASAWYNLGVTTHRYGGREDALDFYSRAIERDRRLTLAYFYRGALRAQHGQNDLAKADWQAVLAIDPASDFAKIVEILLQFHFSPQMKEHLDKIASPATVRYLL
jgi:tetratricopeptide (TPR) repeat protein